MRRILRTFPTSRQRRKADRVGQRMGVEYMARQIYQDVISRVTRTEADWKAVCRLAGQIYRYEFDNVLMVYAQNPSATLVADYDTWKKECKADMEPGGGGEPVGFTVGTVETGRGFGGTGNRQKKPDETVKSLYKAGSALF